MKPTQCDSDGTVKGYSYGKNSAVQILNWLQRDEAYVHKRHYAFTVIILHSLKELALSKKGFFKR